METQKISDLTPFASLTVGQAKEIINDLLLTLVYRPVEKPKPLSDTMDIDETMEFLKYQGVPVTLSTLYNKTFNRSIPFRKMGKRLLFSRKELLQWIESKTTRPESKSDAALRIAQSVNRKG